MSVLLPTSFFQEVKAESQPVGQGTNQRGAEPGTGMAMLHLETALMSLRQGLGALGTHGRRFGGSQGA